MIKDFKLSPHFLLSELLTTEHKEYMLLQEKGVQQYLNNLYILCNYILEPIRCYYNVPITVTSGFRCKELNDAVGGNIKSDHCCFGGGAAADFIVKGKTVDEVFNDIKDGKIDICYRQLIKEKVAGKFWIHIASFRLPYNAEDKYKQNLTTTDGKNYTQV